MKFTPLTTLAVLLVGAQALSKPAPIAAREPQILEQCTGGTAVQSCSICPFGFLPITCKPGSSGPRECTCTLCGYACQDDSVKRDALPEPEPEPKAQGLSFGSPQIGNGIGNDATASGPAGDIVISPRDGAPPGCSPLTVVQPCSQCPFGVAPGCPPRLRFCTCATCGDTCENIPVKRAPEPQPEPAPVPQLPGCSPLGVVGPCSKCPYGFGGCKPGSSGPRECTCIGCNYACQDDTQKKRSAVPPPELICPAEGTPVQSCGLCGAGYDRCDEETGICQCQFCQGPSSFCTVAKP